MSSEAAVIANDRWPGQAWADMSAYVSSTMEFRCNLKCTHCMIEGTMDWLTPQTAEQLDAVIARNVEERLWRGLILTGSEITLNKDLPRMAERARAAGFEHVRIQTHGMHLANPAFTRRLVEAGVDEFFISVTAGEETSHDAITQVPGSFERILKGMDNLEPYDVVAITNTVMTTSSYRSLPELVHRLGHLKRLRQMEFWNYWPMKETDEKDLIVRHTDLMPVLFEAIEQARALGRRVEVKNVPQCLLGPYKDVLVNDQPELMIDERFWGEFARNGFDQCVYRPGCGASKCLGLNTGYVKKFGWEADILAPQPIV